MQRVDSSIRHRRATVAWAAWAVYTDGMRVFLSRHRWLLPIACLAVMAMAAISWWQVSSARGRFTPELYDRIRIGMTPAEVSRLMGSPPSDPERLLRMSPAGGWDWVAGETNNRPWPYEKAEVWLDGSFATAVCYRDGKAVLKTMKMRVPAWQARARQWLRWLRGQVGA
jgi:hypothetical protein